MIFFYGTNIRTLEETLAIISMRKVIMKKSPFVKRKKLRSKWVGGLSYTDQAVITEAELESKQALREQEEEQNMDHRRERVLNRTDKRHVRDDEYDDELETAPVHSRKRGEKKEAMHANLPRSKDQLDRSFEIAETLGISLASVMEVFQTDSTRKGAFWALFTGVSLLNDPNYKLGEEYESKIRSRPLLMMNSNFYTFKCKVQHQVRLGINARFPLVVDFPSRDVMYSLVEELATGNRVLSLEGTFWILLQLHGINGLRFDCIPPFYALLCDLKVIEFCNVYNSVMKVNIKHDDLVSLFKFKTDLDFAWNDVVSSETCIYINGKMDNLRINNLINIHPEDVELLEGFKQDVCYGYGPLNITLNKYDGYVLQILDLLAAHRYVIDIDKLRLLRENYIQGGNLSQYWFRNVKDLDNNTSIKRSWRVAELLSELWNGKCFPVSKDTVSNKFKLMRHDCVNYPGVEKTDGNRKFRTGAQYGWLYRLGSHVSEFTTGLDFKLKREKVRMFTNITKPTFDDIVKHQEQLTIKLGNDWGDQAEMSYEDEFKEFYENDCE
jgi:hypothetical protein